MAIYSRDGISTVTIVRMATIDDVWRFERRKPDRNDRERTAEGYRVVAMYVDTGKEFLADVAYLRADGGWREIETKMIEACETIETIEREGAS